MVSDAGTVTGSIMDFNEATSDEENTAHNRGLLGYAERNNNNTMGLSHHDSDPHNLRSAGKLTIAAFVWFCALPPNHISRSCRLKYSIIYSYISHLLYSIYASVTHPSNHISFNFAIFHADTHYPTSTTHTHISHPSHPLQLQDSYGTAVRSATKLLADGTTIATTTGEGQEEG